MQAFNRHHDDHASKNGMLKTVHVQWKPFEHMFLARHLRLHSSSKPLLECSWSEAWSWPEGVQHHTSSYRTSLGV
jgi:hypothetical protein